MVEPQPAVRRGEPGSAVARTLLHYNWFRVDDTSEESEEEASQIESSQAPAVLSEGRKSLRMSKVLNTCYETLPGLIVSHGGRQRPVNHK